MKKNVSAKRNPPRNPMAQALRHGLFQKKIVRDKTMYTRKGRRTENQQRFSLAFGT